MYFPLGSYPESAKNLEEPGDENCKMATFGESRASMLCAVRV